MDQIFEIAVRDRYAPLLLHRGNLAKPNSYYHRISPTAAAEVDARLAAKRPVPPAILPPNSTKPGVASDAPTPPAA